MRLVIGSTASDISVWHLIVAACLLYMHPHTRPLLIPSILEPILAWRHLPTVLLLIPLVLIALAARRGVPLLQPFRMLRYVILGFAGLAAEGYRNGFAAPLGDFAAGYRRFLGPPRGAAQREVTAWLRWFVFLNALVFLCSCTYIWMRAAGWAVGAAGDVAGALWRHGLGAGVEAGWRAVVGGEEGGGSSEVISAVADELMVGGSLWATEIQGCHYRQEPVLWDAMVVTEATGRAKFRWGHDGSCRPLV